MNLEGVLQRGIIHELSTTNQEVVDKIIYKIIESEVLVKKDSNVIIEPMMYNDEEYGTCFTITCLFDEESPYYDVSIELCNDCLIIHYRKKDEKNYKNIHNEEGDFLLHKDFAKKLYDYVEENKDTIFNKVYNKRMSENDDKSFQDEWKLEKEMIKNHQVCETCKHWQVGNSEPCLKKFICHLPHHTCLNWEEGIKAEYYPYPPNSTWEEKEEINKKHIEEWKKYLKTLDKVTE